MKMGWGWENAGWLRYSQRIPYCNIVPFRSLPEQNTYPPSSPDPSCCFVAVLLIAQDEIVDGMPLGMGL